MIDLETLGQRPDSVILSIGAVAFNEDGPVDDLDPFYLVLNAQDQLDNGRTVTMSTVQWWMDQPKEARDEAFADLDRAVPLDVALVMLDGWWGRVEGACGSPIQRVWANSPQFDLVILENAYYKAGFHEPWHFRQAHDFRTLKSLVNVTDLAVTDTLVTRAGIQHHALDDAKFQAVRAAVLLRAMNRRGTA
jgi:hypothetical protein